MGLSERAPQGRRAAPRQARRRRRCRQGEDLRAARTQRACAGRGRAVGARDTRPRRVRRACSGPTCGGAGAKTFRKHWCRLSIYASFVAPAWSNARSACGGAGANRRGSSAVGPALAARLGRRAGRGCGGNGVGDMPGGKGHPLQRRPPSRSAPAQAGTRVVARAHVGARQGDRHEPGRGASNIPTFVFDHTLAYGSRIPAFIGNQ